VKRDSRTIPFVVAWVFVPFGDKLWLVPVPALLGALILD
jgi:ribosome biogenesis protein Tsr3